MATSDLAVQAAQQAMERAGVSPADIDLVLVGTFTPDMSFPSTACLVQDRLGICAARPSICKPPAPASCTPW